MDRARMNAESFNLDHRLVEAPYVRIADRKTLPGGDVLIKYDVRFTQPNVARLDTQALHSIEHMSAEFMRNHTDRLIDFSPMGCRTGFYALTLGLEPDDFLPVLAATCEDILNAQEVPAANATQCGWGAHHSLAGARAAVAAFLAGRDAWTRVHRDTPYPAATDATATRNSLVNASCPRPGIDGVVDAVILFAMEEEMAPLFGDSLPEPVGVFGPTRAYRVDAGDHVVLAATTGIGPVSAAQAAGALLAHIRPGALLSAGTCGGLGDAAVGDVIAAASCRYGDVDATAFGYAPGQVPGMPEEFAAAPSLVAAARDLDGVTVGTLVTSQSFITGPEAAARVCAACPDALGADMESAALAQVAYLWDTPFLALRCVSDLCAGNGGATEFSTHLDLSAARAARYALTAACGEGYRTGGTPGAE
ncbi:S-ribosylhomocysteine lyase [Winkia sp. C62]|uniref:S-ribosylhomocysteine lyase n=2 Tax=Nanchangia anserum TaxID=2692125 RepID=A0A8I0GBM9_9ACTO|nr:S-ribosylhomocysteine lyase [Nanchangia anserum]